MHLVAHGHRAAGTQLLSSSHFHLYSLFLSLKQLETGQAGAEGQDKGCAMGKERLEGSSCWSSRGEDAELLTPAPMLNNQVLPAADITPKTHLPFNSHHIIHPQSLFLASSVKPSEIVPVFLNKVSGTVETQRAGSWEPCWEICKGWRKTR